MRRIVVFLCILTLLLTMVTGVTAANIQQKENELKEIGKEIKDTKNEIEQVKKEQAEVSKQLQAIEKDLLAKENELIKVEEELNNTQLSLENTKQELEKAIEIADEHEKLMADRLCAMYMMGSTSYLELLFEAKNINDFLDRIEMVKHMVAYDSQVFDGMKAYQDQVEDKKEILEKEEQIVRETKSEVSRQKVEIEGKKQERKQLMAKLKDQEAAFESELDELEKTSKDIEKTIQDLLKEIERKRKEEEERKKREQAQNSGNAGSGTENKYTGGILTWPVPGFYRITSEFGNRPHPVYGTYRMHSGIDIGSNYIGSKQISIYGQDFVAGADGTVILSQMYSGYGNCVIVNHGGGVTTLYAHGSRRLVSVGQSVKRGQPVMKVGNTGVSTGAHAHFEVRENGTPVNPMKYLGK